MGKLRRSIRLHVLFACALGITAPVFARTWTDDSGKYSCKADLVGVGKDTVRLKRDDGKIITVPIARLSRADRAYAAKIGQRLGPGCNCPGIEVTAAPRPDIIEISGGLDDGIRKGDKFMVVRPSTGKLIGCIEVIQVDCPNQALCRPDPKLSKAPIQRGDYLRTMPKAAESGSERTKPAQPMGK